MLYSYKVEQAIRAAAVLHDGQSRKGVAPYPYITHLIAVSFLLSDYSNDEDTVVAGLLHDTLEDTDYTPEELEADFGKKVRTIVEGVTDVSKDERKNYTWEERQEEYFKKLTLAPLESLMVSAADKIHNMRSIVEEYHDKPGLYSEHFSGSTDGYITKYDRLKMLLHDRLENDILNEYDHVHELFHNFLLSIKKHEQKSK